MTTSITVYANATTTTTEPYERPFGEVAVWVSAFIIFTFLVIGIILNSVTVAVILRYKELRNLFVYFIFSLCISDLLSAIISPFFWYRRTLGFDLWELPDFFCKFYWAADIMTSFATAMHIVAFGLFRLISIKYPHSFAKISNRVGIVCVVAIWIVSFGCGFVPFYIWFGARIRDRYGDSEDARWPACTINMEWYHQYVYFQKIAYSLFLYVPLVLVVVISILTAIQVYATTRSHGNAKNSRQSRKEKQAFFQLTLIVFSFLIGYVPFTAYEFWSTQKRENTKYNKQFDYHFGLIEYFFIRLSECLNPVFYNIGSTKMRKHTRCYLQELIGKRPRSASISTSGNISTERGSIGV